MSNTMRASFHKFTAALFAACLFTLFACSGDDGGGNTESFFTDTRDNKTYRTVKIGTQVWMAENLNYKDYGYCYNDNSTNCGIYGRLYDWLDAIEICPSGWHLPTAAEWRTLINSAGGESNAGKKLRAKSGWDANTDGSSGNGTDDYGFSALPGGSRDILGSRAFSGMGYSSEWWSATTSLGEWWTLNEADIDFAVRSFSTANFTKSFDCNNCGNKVLYDYDWFSKSYYVRCVKN